MSNQEIYQKLYAAAKVAGVTDCTRFKPFGYVLDNEVKIETPKEITVSGEFVMLRCDNWIYLFGREGLDDFDDCPEVQTIVTDFLMTALGVDTSTPEAFGEWKRSTRPAYIVGTQGEDWMFLTLHEARCYANAMLLTDPYVIVEKVNWKPSRKRALSGYEDAVESFLNDESSVVRGAGIGLEPYTVLAVDPHLGYTGVCTAMDIIAGLRENAFPRTWRRPFTGYRFEGTGVDGRKAHYDVFLASEEDENGDDDLQERIGSILLELPLKDVEFCKL